VLPSFRGPRSGVGLRVYGKGRFELLDCEVKSSWLRVPKAREKRSPFLHALDEGDRTRLADAYLGKTDKLKTVIMLV